MIPVHQDTHAAAQNINGIAPQPITGVKKLPCTPNQVAGQAQWYAHDRMASRDDTPPMLETNKGMPDIFLRDTNPKEMF